MRILVLLLTIFLGAPCFAVTLFGNANHSEQLSPLPSKYMPGSPMYDGLMPQKEVLWYRVSPRLAGVWQTISEYGTFRHDYATGQSWQGRTPLNMPLDTLKIGFQQDAQGNIWHCDFRDPSKPSIYQNGNRQYTLTCDGDLFYVEDADNSVKTTRAYITVSSENLITEAIQTQQISAYKLTDSNTLLQKGSAKIFNMNGVPVALERKEETSKKIADFRPIDFLNGVDLKLSFYNFLRSQGLEYLANKNSAVPSF